MSLRVDDRSGGRSRSRQRSRSRDARGPSPSPAAKEKKAEPERRTGIGEEDVVEERRTSKYAPKDEGGDLNDRRPSRRGTYPAKDDEEDYDAKPTKSRTFPSRDDDDKDRGRGTSRRENFDYEEDNRHAVIPGLSSLKTKGLALDDDEPEYQPRKKDKLAEEAERYAPESHVSDKVRMPFSPMAMDDDQQLPGTFPPPNDHQNSPQYHPRAQSYTVPYPMPDSGDSHQDDRHRAFSYTPMPTMQYEDPPPYHYASTPEKISYAQKPRGSERTPSLSQDVKPQSPPGRSRQSSYPYDAEVREIRPRDSGPRSFQTQEVRPHRQSLSVNERGSDPRAPSPNRLGAGMQRLSVSGSKPDIAGGGKPPASPLLEAYHGTYQSISPMPSPMMLAASGSDTDDVPQLDSLSRSSTIERERDTKTITKTTTFALPDGTPKTTKKKVKIYDAEKDALELADAMSHSTARPGPLIAILPELSHDQLLELRVEYKKHCKVAGRGVNIAKHVKVKTSGNFGKIAYVTALGRWESEAYWANFWYQSHSSNRELLIEALMGRTNADIREIRDSFRDKRYNDSLSKCMEKELKPDKFRTAVLLALEERRQEETDVWSTEYRNRDVETLHRALTAREGGESAILQVVVLRSDNHLREVLKTYERKHGDNFARAALKKSNNLVGEVIAHILNGAINRPARDTLLLRHALNDISAKNKAVELRYELLMSRLVRLHWDRLHMARVKAEFRKRYGAPLEAEVEDATRGEFGEFCLRLCEA